MPLHNFAIRGGRVLCLVCATCETVLTRIVNEMRLDTLVGLARDHTCPEVSSGPDGTA